MAAAQRPCGPHSQRRPWQCAEALHVVHLAIKQKVYCLWPCMHVAAEGIVPAPTCHRYNLRIRLYRPRSASLLQTFLCWLSGMPAEFADGRFPAAGAGREGVWWLGSC